MEIVQDIELTMSLASAVPAMITFVQTEMPEVDDEVKADYAAIATPAEAIIADVEVDIKGGAANVVTQNVEKTVADLGLLVTAVQAIVPKVETYGEGEYAKLYPVVLPLASALKITLPVPPTTSAA